MPNTPANSYFRSLPWFPPVPTHPRQMNHLPWNHHTTVLACITLTVVSSHEAESSSYLAQNLHSIQQMFDKLAYLGLSPTPQDTFYRSHSSESFTINLTLIQNKPGDSQGTCDTGLAFPVFPGLLVCESADDSLCTATTWWGYLEISSTWRQIPSTNTATPRGRQGRRHPPNLQSKKQRKRLNNLPKFTRLTKLRLKQIQDLKLNSSSDSPCWFAENISSENITLLIT